ncbi:hypothetical protein ABT084_33615 [Streptomyces sp. NPDC002138]|uniref:hypothetical protein n=1 Tax=Streptomyces sp. NPDC002138 TaxID=3154410 RepID=UPI00333110C2
MMRRAVKLLGACAAAAVLALAAPGAAQAARGVLIIDGARYGDPAGCYGLGDFVPSRVVNGTDTTAWVWSGAQCDGEVVQAILSGQGAVAHGRSLFIE